MDNRSQTRDLTCPACKGKVAASSYGCHNCHVSIAEIRQHAASRRSGSRRLLRAVRIRLTGAVLYSAAVAWCAYQLPTALPFVVPGAVLGGGILHVWKGRPWLGLLVFAIVVVAVPLLLWPSLGTGLFAELTDDL
jgi:hypothetical protein